MLKSVLLEQISAKLNMKPEYNEYKKANDVSVFIAKGIVEDIRQNKMKINSNITQNIRINKILKGKSADTDVAVTVYTDRETKPVGIDEGIITTIPQLLYLCATRRFGVTNLSMLKDWRGWSVNKTSPDKMSDLEKLHLEIISRIDDIYFSHNVFSVIDDMAVPGYNEVHTKFTAECMLEDSKGNSDILADLIVLYLYQSFYSADFEEKYRSYKLSVLIRYIPYMITTLSKYSDTRYDNIAVQYIEYLKDKGML